MPRDLEALAGKNASHELPHLTKSPEALDQGLYEDDEQETTLESILSQRNEKRDEIHPYTQTLSLSDIDSCVLLEEQAFPPNERCTREKVSPCFLFSLARELLVVLRHALSLPVTKLVCLVLHSISPPSLDT